MSRPRTLMQLAAAIVVAAQRRRGDTIEALALVARAFGAVLPIVAASPVRLRRPRVGARRHKVERKRRRRAVAKNAEPPIAPAAEKKVLQARVKPQPAAPQPAPVATSPGIDGIKVTTAADAETISFRDRETEITAKQAAFLAILAKGSPNPIGRRFIADRLWPGRDASTHDVYLGGLVSETRPAVESIGPTLKTVRGVGIALQPAEA